jgi:GLPGLI family protein
MKRILLLSLFTVLVANIQVVAQTDYTKLSVTYNEHYLRFEEDDTLSLDVRRLDIGEYSSYYYSLIKEWYMLHSEGRAPYPGTRSRDGCDFVYKNMPKKGIITFEHTPYALTTQDSIQQLFDWQLLEGDSVVCSYPCKKAQTTFRGRTWTVWYSLDLPYSDGPWKLSGLPGLILHARDNEGKLIFNCIGIEKGDGHSFSYPSSKKIRLVSPERMEELLIFEAYDIEGFEKYFDPTLVGLKVYDRNGRLISNIHWTAVPYEVFPQNHKKKPVKKKPATKKRRKK